MITVLGLNRRGRSAGFTMIEMMICVAIVGILAAIAIPQYSGYQLKVKSAESRSLLGSITTAQESFCAEYGEYAQIPGHPITPPGMHRRQWTETSCNQGCNRLNTAQCDSFDCIGFQPAAMVYYTYGANRRVSAPGQPPEFGAGAAGDLDSDGILGSYAIHSGNYGGDVGVVADGVSSCPPDIPVRLLMTCTINAW